MFNRNVSAARIHVERAFGTLKVRWRILLNCLNQEIQNVSHVIISCCILHNICQIRNENFIDENDILGEVIQAERQAKIARRRNGVILSNTFDIQRETLKYYVNNM